MAGVFNQMYVHLVWRTKYSARILDGELEAFVKRRMGDIARDQRLSLLAFGSAWDHVHLLFHWNTTCAVGDVVQRLKSFTSTEWNKSLIENKQDGPRLAWQGGYGVVTIRHSELETVIKYVENQREHHKRKRLSPDFEATEPPK